MSYNDSASDCGKDCVTSADDESPAALAKSSSSARV